MSMAYYAAFAVLLAVTRVLLGASADALIVGYAVLMGAAMVCAQLEHGLNEWLVQIAHERIARLLELPRPHRDDDGR